MGAPKVWVPGRVGADVAGTGVVAATTGVILAAVYLLWAVQRTVTGEPDGDNLTMKDVKVRELATVVPLLGLSLFLGFYPNPVLDRVEPSIDRVIEHVEANSDYEVPRITPPAVEEAEDAEEHE